MIGDAVLMIILFATGITAGMYITSQMEIRLSKRTRLSPTKINISYVEQGRGMFYGMYIHNDAQRYVKLSNITEANGVLKSMGVDIPIPDSISLNNSVLDLNNIVGKFNEEHGGYCVLDWSQCMDVS
tara:strand:+ start:260 stop:640 length:381 start_codon:yes stop_codon:yes gene_type:complete